MPDEDVSALATAIARHIESHEPHAAVRAALDAVDAGLPIPSLYRDVVTPLLVGEGERWQHGEEHVWQEHYGTAVLRTVVEALSPTVARLSAEAAATGRSALLACPPQEPHDLGLRMLADRFELAGWKPYFLGADVPANEIVAAAEALRPDLLVLSASTHFNRIELRDVVDRIRPLLPAGVVVRVTGTAFERSREGWGPDEVLDPDRLPVG